MIFNDMLGKVYACEALDLLQRIPSQCIDAVIGKMARLRQEQELR